MSIPRTDLLRGAATVAAVTVLALLFIGSYAGALHEPRPHDVPLAVSAALPARLAAGLGASPAFAVDRVATPAAARSALDHRDDYAAVLPGRRGLELIVSEAASPAVEQLVRRDLAAQLRRSSGAPVRTTVVHPLPAADGRGLVAFYLAIGWVFAGYLGATMLGLAFGTSPARPNALVRLGGLLALGAVLGLTGSLLARGIAGYHHGLAEMWLLGALTVSAVGAATMAFQSLLGVAGTGLAILVFVVLGNPAAGGPYATELLPGLWRAAGRWIPPGAATTGVRDAAYFPAAGIGGPLLVLLAWLVAGVAIALVLGDRGRRLTRAEEEASLAAVAG